MIDNDIEWDWEFQFGDTIQRNDDISTVYHVKRRLLDVDSGTPCYCVSNSTKTNERLFGASMLEHKFEVIDDDGG